MTEDIDALVRKLRFGAAVLNDHPGQWYDAAKHLNAAADALTRLAVALGEAYDNAGRSATDRFDVPPEHEPNPNGFHLGWETCAREIAGSIATKKIVALAGRTEAGNPGEETL